MVISCIIFLSLQFSFVSEERGGKGEREKRRVKPTKKTHTHTHTRKKEKGRKEGKRGGGDLLFLLMIEKRHQSSMFGREKEMHIHNIHYKV